MARKVTRFLAVVFAITAAGGNSSFVGTWEGKVNDLPAVELSVREDGREVSGSIAFYFQTRGSDGKWRLGEKMTLPLLSPEIKGNVLTFETIHHKKHGSPELGPNNRYRADMVNAKELRLHIIKDDSSNQDAGLKLSRRE